MTKYEQKRFRIYNTIGCIVYVMTLALIIPISNETTNNSITIEGLYYCGVVLIGILVSSAFIYKGCSYDNDPPNHSGGLYS